MNAPMTQNDAGVTGGGKVSVVIPALRAADTIATAVRSALADNAVGEVIVVLDGPDDALRVAVPDDVGVHVIVTAQTRGAPAARNTGLAAATAEFALFLDADDFVEDGLITSLAQAAGEADVAFGSYAFAFPSGKRIPVDVQQTIGTPTVGHVLKAWLEGHYVPCCSVLWRTSFVRAIGGWNEDLLKNQDGELVWRACRAGPRMALGTSGRGIYMQSPSAQRVSSNRSRAMYEQQMALLGRIQSESVDGDLRAVTGELGAVYYRLARNAYYNGFADIGRDAERAASLLGFNGHSGTAGHRIAATLLGLKRKEELCQKLHRAERALGLMPGWRDLAAAEQ